MTRQALTQKLYLEVTPPQQGDNLADLDRLRRALEQKLGDVILPYQAVRRSYTAIRTGEYRVTATLFYSGRSWTLQKLEPGDTRLSHYGLAADLGSTTVSLQLFDCNSGLELASETAVNKQVQYGADILSRIFYTKDSEEHRQQLQKLTAETLNELTEAVCQQAGIAPDQISSLVVAGNTTMMQFLYCIDAFPVFMAPFAPIFNRMEPVPAKELGLMLDGVVYAYASAANYLGGDVIAGILATGMASSEELSLLIDIGTNGEITLGNKDYLIAGAGAAGPALEGAISKHGMRAAPGAVETVVIKGGKLQISTIGGERPAGICGSGIVDLLAQMLLAGWMECSGSLVPGASDAIVELDGQLAVCYADESASASGQALYFTQEDIRQFTDTKAAANTMVACLLQAAGVEAQSIGRIYLAGAFGQHMNLESAITIGLYPDLPRERFVVAGNTSLQGASALLLNREYLNRANQIAETIYYLEFAMQENFLTIMQAARFYPHTDMEQYPSVKKKLGL